jgi:hypothetical protein
MLTFTPRPGEAEPEEAAGIAWLQETLERLAPERGMPAGCSWQIVAGIREAAVGAAGPRLRQTGYQVTALDAAGGAYGVTCFVSIEDAVEAEMRPAVEALLGLWLDRLSREAPGRAEGRGPCS